MYSGFNSKIERKEKMELTQTSMKETVIPSIKVTEPEVELRRRIVQSEEKPFSWYATAAIPRNEPTLLEAKSFFSTVNVTESKPILEEFKSALDEIKAKQEEVMPKGLKESISEDAVDQTAELRQQIQEVIDRERAAVEEKQRLELELSDLASRFDDDEKALASFEQEKRRFQDLIDAQQRKGFDFQQEIIALKNQLVDTQSQLAALKKSAKAAPAEKPAETPAAWEVGHAKGFTEMVAEAQRAELEHPKKFADVVKESLSKSSEGDFAKPAADEFTVVGGDLSAQHILAPSMTTSS